MMQRLFIAILTVLILGAGFLAGVWYERQRPLPGPPSPLMAELGGTAGRPGPENRPPAPPAINRAKLAAEIERLRPQIDDFKRRMDEIDASFDRDFLRLLSPEQNEKQATWQKRRLATSAKADPPATTQPLTDDEIIKLQERPLYYLMSRVIVAMRLESFTHDLKLDADQQAKTRELLRQRREKFLVLLDSSPPPSLMLSRLAPLAQRLAEPKP